MARAIWSGSISFGLVNVPVKLYSAVHHQNLAFHQFQEGTNARVRNKRVSEKTGKEVAYDDIVKGYEVKKGQYVMIEPDELAEFAPRATRTIDIEDFVSLDEIDPIYYDSTYYLAPEDSEGARKAYALLLKAMEDQGKVAIGRLVMRSKQYLAAIRPLEGALAVSTMLFHDEVVAPSDIDQIPTGRSAPKAAPGEVKMAGQIIESMSRDWDPKRYEDTYRVQVLDYLKKKAAGEEVVIEEEPEEQADVTDLMAALEASLEAAKKNGSRRSSSASKSSSTTKKSSSSSAKRSSSSSSSSSAKKAPARKSSSSTSRRSGSGSKRKSA
ncbi:MAG TPA: Ku protein [Acidimicrobiia bacterium]|nr:Ku protein [Acidimicrobiia bacterium]